MAVRNSDRTDENLDLATANILVVFDGVSVLLGNGDGSFADATNFAAEIAGLESDAGEGFSVETDFAIVESDDAVATNSAFIVYNSASGAL